MKKTFSPRGMWLVLVLAACAKSVQPTPGGETNWLKLCTDTDACDQGSCLCGVCTTECAADRQCVDGFAGECVSAASSVGRHACAPEAPSRRAGMCLPNCNTDAACGPGFACREGVCVTRATAMRVDADEPSLVDAGACRTTTEPLCDGLSTFCTWQAAQSRIPGCASPPFTPFYAVRCGSYDGVVSQGTDSATYSYYDDAGKLVGRNDVGLGATGCVSRDPTFTSPPESCEMVTPRCEPDAGTACDCGSTELSLDCVCMNAPCRSFADVTTDQESCRGYREPLNMRSGCGFKIVSADTGRGGFWYVYEGSGNTLVGASKNSDVPFGECRANQYATELPDLSGCADYAICDLCGLGLHPPCQL